MAEQHGKTLVPQIRFAGFTDPWEQHKLGELAEIKDSARVPNNLWSTSGVPYIRASDVSNGDLQGALFLSQEVFDFYRGKTGSPVRGDVLFNGGGEIGKSLFINTDQQLYVQGGAVLYARTSESKRLDGVFLSEIFQSRTVKKYIDSTSKGGTMKHFTLEPAKSMHLLIPNDVSEQHDIGIFLRDLDDLLTFYQRRYDKLCVLKKSMLDKMFPKGGSLYPEIRFAGFTDPWEQRKLGEVARRVTRKNENGDSDLPLTISAQYGLVDQRTFFNSQVASKDMSGYFLLHRGEFAYNKSTSADSPWGAIKRLEKYDMGCVSTLYICFELLSGDPDFLVTYYETDRWYKAVQLIAAEGARNHGLLNIAPDDFFETQICIPKRIDEQCRIGAVFNRLDSLITLHQRKLEVLRNIKKSMLDKMFV